MLQSSAPLRKSAPWPANISDEHVSCTTPATPNSSSRIPFPAPAIVFRQCDMLQPNALLTLGRVQNPLHPPCQRTSEHRKAVLDRQNSKLWLRSVLRASTACLFLASQRRALFRHLNFQDRSKRKMLFAFSLAKLFWLFSSSLLLSNSSHICFSICPSGRKLDFKTSFNHTFKSHVRTPQKICRNSRKDLILHGLSTCSCRGRVPQFSLKRHLIIPLDKQGLHQPPPTKRRPVKSCQFQISTSMFCRQGIGVWSLGICGALQKWRPPLKVILLSQWHAHDSRVEIGISLRSNAKFCNQGLKKNVWIFIFSVCVICSRLKQSFLTSTPQNVAQGLQSYQVFTCGFVSPHVGIVGSQLQLFWKFFPGNF